MPKPCQQRPMIDDCVAQFEALRQGTVHFHALSAGHYPGKPIPRGILPGLSGIGWVEGRHRHGWHTGLHCNEGVEISFLERGASVFQSSGVRQLIGPGTLTMTAPWHEHRHGDPTISHGRLHWVIIDVGVRTTSSRGRWRWPSWLSLQANDLTDLNRRLMREPSMIRPASGEIAAVFSSLSAQLEYPGKRRWSHLAVDINRLLLCVLELLHGEVRSLPVGNTDAAAVFLRNLAADPAVLAQPWTTVSMAARCRLGTTKFTADCKAVTNESPMRYLRNCRLEVAALRLRENPRVDLTRLALDCGFSSAQFFSTCFKQRFDASPGRYRERFAAR